LASVSVDDVRDLINVRLAEVPDAKALKTYIFSENKLKFRSIFYLHPITRR
jgi:hypothetical protein